MPQAASVRPRSALGNGATPPFARWAVLSIAGVVAVTQFVASLLGGGYWFDEVTMLAIGRNHLDWGSADQPPLTPLLATLMDWIAPGSIVALRLGPIRGVRAVLPRRRLRTRDGAGCLPT